MFTLDMIVSGAHISKSLFFDHQFSDKNIHDFLIENHCLKLENHFYLISYCNTSEFFGLFLLRIESYVSRGRILRLHQCGFAMFS